MCLFQGVLNVSRVAVARRANLKVPYGAQGHPYRSPVKEPDELPPDGTELGDDLPAGLRIAVWDADEVAYRLKLEDSVRQARVRLHRYVAMGDVPPSVNVAVYVLGLCLVSGSLLTLGLSADAIARTLQFLLWVSFAAGASLGLWIALHRARVRKLMLKIRADSTILFTDPESVRSRENLELLSDVETQLRFAHHWTLAEHVASARGDIVKRYG
jgi:hypothetical protein